MYGLQEEKNWRFREGDLLKYIKLYFRFVIVYIKAKQEYHFALWLELLANTVLIGIYFAGFWIIFYNFETVAGWNKYEVLFMFTTSWLAYSFSCFFFWSPMRDIGELVRTGKFDLYLTRPISPFVYLVLCRFQYTFLPRLLFSVVFWIYSMKKLQIDWTLERTVFYGVSLFSAFVIFSSVTVLTGAICFWMIKSEEVVSLLTDNNYGLKNFCDYPIRIYKKGMRIILTFVVPYAFTGYYPVATLLGKDVSSAFMGKLSPLIAAVTGILSCVLWRRGLKRYNSAN